MEDKVMPDDSCVHNMLRNTIKEFRYQEVIDICNVLLEQIDKEPMEDILPKHKVIELKVQALEGL